MNLNHHSYHHHHFQFMAVALTAFHLCMSVYGSNDVAPPSYVYDLPWWHPEIDYVLKHRIPGPANHPKLDNLSSFQTYIRLHTDEEHDFFDGSNGYVQRPRRLPGDHPPIDPYIAPTEAPSDLLVELPDYHPDVDEMLLMGIAIPTVPNDHPSVQVMYENHLPDNHPNVDDIFSNPTQYSLPDWHPTMNEMVLAGKTISFADIVTLPYNHPEEFSDYYDGEPIDDHPSIHYYFEDNLPKDHPNIDDLLKNPQPLPDWHPQINQLVEVRNLWYAPGTIFTVLMFVMLQLAWAVRSLRKAMKRSQQVTPTVNKDTFVSEDIMPLSNNLQLPEEAADDALQFSPETLPHRRWILHQAVTLNAEHHDDALGYEIISPSLKRHMATIGQQDISNTEVTNNDTHASRYHSHMNGSSTTPSTLTMEKKKKQTTFHAYVNRIFHGRFANSHWSTGNAFICTIYLFLNALCALGMGVAGLYPYDVGIGTLGGANLIFLIMVATRNSLLTWCLGIAFDHIILYHRFIGRVTIVLGIVHAAFYVDKFNTDAIGTKTFVSGIVALVCGLGIGATTTNWMRRNHFNIFFWTHYLFVGFFAGVFLHAPGAVPYVALATVLFVIDKVLRIVWTLLPQKTTVFRTRSESTAQVQFPKNFLVRMMGRHKVGQYCFVNFPELSKMEWHPFSVSSSPDDPYIELHIRNLGDHTKRIVEYAKECAETNRQVLIRSDGPYGNLNFNYRRYDKLFLVGGGIGVTPIIGILKDLYCYSDNDYNDSKKKKRKAHRIEKVRLVWVMPRASEAALFLDMLLQFSMSAREDPGLPELKLSIHCTREEEGNARPPIVTARPNFPSLLRDVMYYNGSETSEESMSTLVFACGPKGMVNQLWDESKKMNTKHSRVDFHHEVFEF